MRLFFVVFSVVMILSGCKSAQKSVEEKKRDVKVTRSEAQLLESLRNKESEYPHSISYKANAKYANDGKSTSVKTTVRMVTDSAIWLSISSYGYEAVRILATPDSLHFIDRIEKKYYVGDYSFFEEKLGVGLQFSDLQSVLLGQSLGLDDEVNFSRGVGRQQLVLSSTKSVKYILKDENGVKQDTTLDVLFFNWVNPQTYQVEQVQLVNTMNQNKADIFYTSFEQIDSISVLSGFKMKIIAGTQGELSADFSKIEINPTLVFPFKISDKYEQIK